jgi:uncharacterized protein YbjT (DUF2867 family)
MNILILGAAGQIARVATRELLGRTDATLTLYARTARRLGAQTPRSRIIEGDVMDSATLAGAMTGQDLVYANLSGSMAAQARTIVAAMKQARVGRILFISSMGIYDEVPGARYRSVLDPYRDSARVIETSGLDYAILRPAWLSDEDEIAYGTTAKGEAFRNSTAFVSRKSVADLIVKLVAQTALGNVSLGVHKA